MKKTATIIAISILFALSATAQMRSGKRNFKLYKYEKAIKSFKKVVAKNDEKNIQEATTKIAHSYRMLRNNQEAYEWYDKAVKFENVDSKIIFYYAEALRGVGKYVEAAKQFRKYASLTNNADNSLTFAEYCDQVEIWKEYEENYTLKTIEGLNSPDTEYSPTTFKNGLIFASNRIGDSNTNKSEFTIETSKRLKLLKSAMSNDSVKSIELFIKKTLSDVYHDGPATVGRNDSLVFFTRVYYSGGNKEKDERIKTSLLKLYYTELKKDGNWTTPKSFEHNQDTISMAHPSLSKDGKTLYFVSDLDDSRGKSDIYSCEFVNGKWTNPENLGDVINTSGREMFPYVKDENTLYFSSDMHTGYGGLDIFRTTMKNGKWQKPVNLRFPVNTSYDDFGICLIASTDKGYISSNRPESIGADDIFSIKEHKIVPVLPVCGRVYDGQPDNSDVKLFILNRKTNKVRVEGTKKDGSYCIDMERGVPYVVRAAKPNFKSCVTVQELSAVKKVVDPTLNYDCPVERLPKVEVSFSDTIFYNFDRSKLRLKSKETLDSLKLFMAKYPESKLKIISFTDVQGVDIYNKFLSQRRAKSVKKYLVKNGLNKDRIETYGMGEFKVPEGTKLTRDYHQWCRRSELQINYKKEQKESLKDFGKYEIGKVYDISDFEEGFFE